MLNYFIKLLINYIVLKDNLIEVYILFLDTAIVLDKIHKSAVTLFVAQICGLYLSLSGDYCAVSSPL